MISFGSIKISGSLCIMSLSLNVFAVQYTVQKGDTLSRIAAAHYPGPIYGENGSLKKILILNSKIKNPDVIYYGQKLRLFEEEPKDTQILESKEKKLVKKTDIGFIPYSTMTIFPKLRYMRISGIDNTNKSSAKIYSSESVQMDIGWQLHWTKKFSTSVGFHYSTMKFQKVSNRNFNDSASYTAGMSVGIEYKILRRTLAYSSLMYGSHLYLYAPTTTTLQLHKGSTLSNKTGLKYTFLDLSPIRFSIFGGIGAIMPTNVDSYKSKFSYSRHIGFELSHTLKSGKRIMSALDIDHGQKDTKPFNQKHDNMSLGIGIDWRIK